VAKEELLYFKLLDKDLNFKEHVTFQASITTDKNSSDKIAITSSLLLELLRGETYNFEITGDSPTNLNLYSNE